MFKVLFSIALLQFSSAATAVPVEFTFAEFTTDAVAGVNAVVDSASNTVSIPPQTELDLPSLSSAFVDGPGFDDFASADAVADKVLDALSLSTAVEASAESGGSNFADAVAVAAFIGEFAGAGLYTLTLDFDSITDFLVPGINAASAELALRIIVGLDTILDTTFMASQLFEFEFMLDDTASAALDLVLIGDALSEAGTVGNIASVDFNLDVRAVPENSSLALALLAFALLASPSRRKNLLLRKARESR